MDPIAHYGILLVTNVLVLVAGAMLAPIYALFVDKIVGDLFDARLTGGVFALAAGITQRLSQGALRTRYAKMNLLSFSDTSLWVSDFYFSQRLVRSFRFFLSRHSSVSPRSSMTPAFDALYSRHLDRRHAGREWGLWEAIHYFAITIGAIVGGFIATKFGFQILFVIMSVLSFISALYIFFLPRKVL